MRKKLLMLLLPLFLLSSCAPTNKCKDPKYVYKEGEHPEKHLAPKFPIKPTPKDYTFNGPELNDKLTPYTNSRAIPQKQVHELAINIYPSRANKWIEKIPLQEEKVLVAEHDINLKEEIKHLEYLHPGIRDGPFIIYNGSKNPKDVFAEVSRVFPLSSFKEDSLTGEKFYPFPENFAGSASDAKRLYNKGIEYALYLEEIEMSEH